MNSICIYCGSSDKTKLTYLEAAYEMGKEVAQRSLVLWFGAGSTGLMGAVADGALEAGGDVIGVIPDYFNTPVLAHQGLTKLEVVASMREQMERLIEQSDAFIALPGGYGTYKELFETLTLAQIGRHQKPVGLLNTNNYFSPLLVMIQHTQYEGFIYNEHSDIFTCADSPAELVDALSNYRRPAGLERWMTRNDE
ncbi:TIGR00730 family Rossman fold protein [Chloroflexota bacterium]